MIHKYRATFHLEVRKGTPKTFMKYFAVGAGLASVIIVTLSIASRPLIHMTSMDLEVRYTAFAFSGVLTDELEVSEAQEFLKYHDVDSSLVFRKTPSAHLVHVSELISKPDSEMYFAYMKNVKASPENMTFILEQITKKEKHNGYDQWAAQEIVKQWPKTQKFPKHLLAKYLDEKKPPEKQRVPATTEPNP